MDCPKEDCEGEVLMDQVVHEYWSFNMNGNNIERVERKGAYREDQQVFFCDGCTAQWTFHDLKEHQKGDDTQ